MKPLFACLIALAAGSCLGGCSLVEGALPWFRPPPPDAGPAIVLYPSLPGAATAEAPPPDGR